MISNVLNSTRDNIKEESNKFQSPYFVKNKVLKDNSKKMIFHKRKFSSDLNNTRDYIRNPKIKSKNSFSKSKLLNDISVSDNDKTFIDKLSLKTPKKTYGLTLKNSKTPEIKNRSNIFSNELKVKKVDDKSNKNE